MPHVPSPKRHPYAQWSPDARALDLVGDKWTLLIVRDLASGPRRFVELQRVLPGISTEQLRSRLNRMVADGMLTRQRYREVPPRVDYELTPRARDLLPVLAELARWGYQWAWSSPRAGERVDLGAIFRLAGGLVSARAQRGTVQFSVSDADPETGPAHYSLHLSPHGAQLTEQTEAADALASAAGTRSSWIRAFSPSQDFSGLSLSGDHGLIQEILAELSQQSIQSAVGRRGEASGADSNIDAGDIPGAAAA
jgi:DNA-binding HxlR family transcriptional regulator